MPDTNEREKSDLVLEQVQELLASPDVTAASLAHALVKVSIQRELDHPGFLSARDIGTMLQGLGKVVEAEKDDGGDMNEFRKWMEEDDEEDPEETPAEAASEGST